MSYTLPTVLGRAPSTREKIVAVGIASALVVAIGAADEATGVHVLVGALYLLPILVATWFLGLGGGMLFAALTTVEWAALRMFGPAFPHLGTRLGLWNALVRFVAMASVAYLLSRARQEGFALRSALERCARLPEVIPICAWCRKLRSDHDEWQTLEQFFAKETDVLFTHGVCAGCAARLREETQTGLEAHGK